MGDKKTASQRSKLTIVGFVVLGLVVGYPLGQFLPIQLAEQTIPPAVPPVKGFYNRQEILFIHTEASDQQVASMLTMMMGSPVILVPGLKEIPPSSLGDVFVFTNGVKGSGPFGFQPDVFNSVPTDRDYTPLRAVTLVTWKEEATARELRSVDEIKDMGGKGALTLSRTGFVVNMPTVRWPGGQR